VPPGRLIKFQMDLMDIQFLNRSYKYILAIIDVFSKYAFLVPLNDKSGESVADALDKLFSYPPLALDVPETVPKMLLSDVGNEFKNTEVFRVCMFRDIGQYFSEPYHPLGIIERFNKTIKTGIRKLHLDNGFPRKKTGFLQKLQVILMQYNTTKHSSTGYPPMVAHFSNDKAIQKEIYERLQEIVVKNVAKQQRRLTEPIVVGDIVRVQIIADPTISAADQQKLRNKQTYKKFSVGHWTKQHFTVAKLANAYGVDRYTLEGHARKLFKRHQLQKVYR